MQLISIAVHAAVIVADLVLIVLILRGWRK